MIPFRLARPRHRERGGRRIFNPGARGFWQAERQRADDLELELQRTQAENLRLRKQVMMVRRQSSRYSGLSKGHNDISPASSPSGSTPYLLPPAVHPLPPATKTSLAPQNTRLFGALQEQELDQELGPAPLQGRDFSPERPATLKWGGLNPATPVPELGPAATEAELTTTPSRVTTMTNFYATLHDRSAPASPERSTAVVPIILKTDTSPVSMGENGSNAKSATPDRARALFQLPGEGLLLSTRASKSVPHSFV